MNAVVDQCPLGALLAFPVKSLTARSGAGAPGQERGPSFNDMQPWLPTFFLNGGTGTSPYRLPPIGVFENLRVS